MTVNDQPRVDQPPVRTAPGRWAVTAVFFLNGLTLSTYIVRAPSFKDTYHLTDGQFGLTGLLFALAALVCMQFVGPLTARVGARTVLRVTLAVMPLLLAGIAVAPSPWWFTALAPVLGAVHGTTDAAMNTSAVAVERRAGRPILNGCHAAWSISAVAASLSTAALAHTEVSLAAHLITAGALLLAAGLVLGPRLPEAGRADAEAGDAAGQDGATDTAGATGPRNGWSGALLLLGLTATTLMICEERRSAGAASSCTSSGTPPSASPRPRSPPTPAARPWAGWSATGSPAAGAATRCSA
ncbi:MFS transporter [Dactylosporangium cerinum]